MFCFLSNCNRALLWTGPISFFLVNYILFCSVLSDAILILLLIFGLEVLDLINICCYCHLILLLVLTCFLNNSLSHQSNAAFFTQVSLLHWRQSFCSYTNF